MEQELEMMEKLASNCHFLFGRIQSLVSRPPKGVTLLQLVLMGEFTNESCFSSSR